MAAPVPDLDALLALPTDDWSLLLAAALGVLRTLPDDQVDQSVRRVVSTPPARLVAGRQRELVARLARRPAVWSRVAGDLDEEVLAALGGAGEDEAGDPAVVAPAALEDALARVAVAEEQAAAATDRAARLRERLDDARRAAEGAAARAEAAEQRAGAAMAARATAEAALAAVRDELAAADEERARAVERERRRAATRDERDRDALRAARRRVAALEQEVADLRGRLTTGAAARAPTPTRDQSPPSADAGRRGRPSRLPVGVEPGTRDAAAWLVGARVPLLVDGYNVTRQHRAELGFAEQRQWLEARVAALARRRGVAATIVWDSSVGASTQRSRSGVTVRYTEPDLTADDELVLHVRTLLEPDDPVVVVTDDGELRERMAALGVDLLDTTSFTWLL